MKRFRSMALCLTSFILALWLGSCASAPAKVVNLNFGAAGMARGALEEVEVLYQQEHPNIVINSIFAGSGVIQKAVERGEPFDGVLFAHTKPLAQLQAKGLILPDSRKELLGTNIVLIAAANSSVQLSDFRELASDRIKTVAIGNENLAIGRYTHTLMTKLGIDQAVKPKTVLFKVDVREVLRAVELGEAEVGITFLSEAKTSSNVKVLATASTELYEPIRSAVAIVKTSAHIREMQAYLDFLSSNQARKVFQKFGLHSLRA